MNESPMVRFVLAGFLAVVACAHTQTMSITDALWQPVWLEGEEFPANLEGSEKAFLRLLDGRVQGYGGCNRIAGSYLLTDSQISFSGLVSTRRACITGMEREGAFLKALGKVSSWKRQGGLLRLYDADKRLLLEMKADPEQTESLPPASSN